MHQKNLGAGNRHSNLSCTSGFNSCLYSDDSSRMMRGISEELPPNNGRSGYKREDLSRGRSTGQQFKKNQSSPSKIFKQYMP